MEVNINFDEASLEWRKNKRKKGSFFFDICDFIYKNGKRCGRDCNRFVTGLKYCRYHLE